MTDEYKGISGFFKRRQHPVKIIMYIARYIWLLLIPLAKYLIATRFDFQNWVKTNWVDILSLSVMIGYGILRWVFVYFEIEEDSIISHTGYFGIEKTQVYFSEMSSMSLCQGYIFRLLGACTVYIDTDARSIQNTDIRLDISQKQAFRIYELATAKCRSKPKYIYTSRKKSLFIFSLLFSSTLSGMLLTLTFIYQAYRIVGREIEEQFLARVNTELEKLTVHIPKYLIVAALVVAGSWLVSFLSNLLRHWGFSCTRCADLLMISSGKGTKRRHVIVRDRINFIDYQQSMFMKLFGICSVQVNCTGYGKRHLELSALVPITTTAMAENSVKQLLPGVPKVEYDVRTGWADLRRFVMLPMLVCLLPGVLYKVLCEVIPQFEMVVKTIPDWKSALTNLSVISMIPLVWLVLVKTNAAFNTAAGFGGGHCVLSYCKFYRFHRTAVRLDRISKIKISRNPFQRMNGTCNLSVYTSAERSSCHLVKGLNYERLINAMAKTGLYDEE
ncbi:PH domain-containing protein [Ruminococcus albus]|uniref:Conserved domain protein n=1 Tax=Ruminococcus albus 8 TaxID=246199 RepID=E9SGG3_RUMAL|nr:PH domain-containing protein [Ruminococcus albus]EGC01682.1 conserved domain protein [Ruminococcus albus 8]MCC3350586.1 PH domain-containing protein [Ruminococcus albus 8]